MGSERVPQSAKRRKLFKVAKEIGLTDEERIALACFLLRRDITTWKRLTEEQEVRLLDACEGYELITELKRQRPITDAGRPPEGSHASS